MSYIYNYAFSALVFFFVNIRKDIDVKKTEGNGPNGITDDMWTDSRTARVKFLISIFEKINCLER